MLCPTCHATADDSATSCPSCSGPLHAAAPAAAQFPSTAQAAATQLRSARRSLP